MNLAEKYIRDVSKGKIVVCEFVSLAVDRHLRDLKTGKDRGLYFDVDAGELAIKFVSLLRHTIGELAGQHFHLQPFQAFILYMIFGWKKSNGKRRFSKVYGELARKNGKTELAAAVALYCLLADGEYGAEIYTAATKREQAKICFNRCRSMAKKLKLDSETVDDAVGVHQHSVHVLDTESYIQPMSSDSNKEDGSSPHCAIVDEYHAHRTSELLEVLETGMGGRQQPILFIITTAGFNRESPCYLFRKVLIDILRGIKEDDSVFGIIFTLDEGDDWKDDKVWVKANPNIGKSPYWDYMRSQFQKAINEGVTKEIQFKTKNLNIWTNTHSTWIQDEKWQLCGGDIIELVSMKGRKCFAGLDLSSTRDLTALCLLFPPIEKEERFKLYWFHWCPEESAIEKERTDGVPYRQWASEGWITLTPGDVIDYNYIKARFTKLNDFFDIQVTEYDRYNSSQLVIDLQEEGFNMSPFGQGFLSMNAPTKEFEKMVYAQEFDHGQNPVLRWMMSNVVIRMDPAGNVKVDKGQTQKKVDGVVAAIMALGGYMTDEREGDSVYDERGIVTV